MDPFLLMDHFGPFVMNTPAEIEQAILDYQQGRVGHLD